VTSSRPLLRDPAAIRAGLDARARALGFDALGVASLDAPWAAGEGLRAFVAAGHHGEMDWMQATLERRAHPRSMWPQARSALVLAMNYGPDADPRDAAPPDRGVISVYARADDYHELIKGRLKTLAQWLRARTGCEAKVFVDTAPLMEKPLAEIAALGFQGKHTNLVSRDFGSWLFLGVILTTLELASDPPREGECGACRACLDACPTGALPAPYRIDARRCISYLTIEQGGPVDPALRPAMGARIYGCDDCLAVCPWNKFASTAREARLHARDALRAPSLAQLAALDAAGFHALFHKSPIRRIGRDRFLRNVLYAIGNSGDPDLRAAAEARLGDGSALVRGAAVWALSRLLAPEAFATLRRGRMADEGDAGVRAEWRAEAAIPLPATPS
jgi:epoxyqueuosine reductase